MRVPTSTYRLQLNADFRFVDACALVPYLATLGITDVYASPIFAARAGSTHGYDVTDPTRLNPDLGDEAAFDAFVRALKNHGMGLIIDIVPNHMAASTQNPWWRDVLEHGRASAYAEYFDIDWTPPWGPLQGRVLLPVLGRHYGRALDKGELRVVMNDDGLAVHYDQDRFPLDPASYPRILTPPSTRERAPAALQDLAHRFGQLPPAFTSDADTAALRREQAASLKRELTALYGDDAAVRHHVDRNIKTLNGSPREPETLDALDELLTVQPYALSFWKAASEEVNYRRFFNISDLVCLRMERESVFQATHALIFRLLRHGHATGVRVDHVDGLYDPADYLERLAAHSDRTYVVVEKILTGRETLPADWTVSGTTGYDFLNDVNGLFVDTAGLQGLDRVYTRFVGSDETFQEIVYRKKQQAMEREFSSDIGALSRTLRTLAASDRHGRDLSARQLGRAIAEVTACLPVYRTYTRDRVDASAQACLDRALSQARRRNPALGTAAFNFLRRVLMLQLPSEAPPATRRAWIRLVMRWQQFSGAVMAKGFEDAALYVYNRLVSLNEVGGEPDAGAVSVPEFHQRNQTRQERWPNALNATSTHDTKRGEDVRARIAVLSEMPARWASRLRRWQRWNRGCKSIVDGQPVPVANEEVLLYQTLIGAWPLDEARLAGFGERLEQYMLKAVREAKEHTSWLRPDGNHEEAVLTFIRRILEPSSENRFRRDLVRFQANVAFYGAVNSLSQVILKEASPGIPDFYRGTELWDLSLVDPDNRRPLDFRVRAQALEALIREEETAGQIPLIKRLARDWRTGHIKLYVTHHALRLRREHPHLFRTGRYLPLNTAGTRTDCVCAFAREASGEWALAAVPRSVTKLSSPGQFPVGSASWGNDTILLPRNSPPRWQNVLTGETLEATAGEDGRELPLGLLLAHLPVALLLGFTTEIAESTEAMSTEPPFPFRATELGDCEISQRRPA